MAPKKVNFFVFYLALSSSAATVKSLMRVIDRESMKDEKREPVSCPHQTEARLTVKKAAFREQEIMRAVKLEE
jgi:hypothetical protein